MARYVTVCADLNQAEEFFPPTTSVYTQIQYQLTRLVRSMHEPVEALVQSSDIHWDSEYNVPPQFVIHNQVWSRLIINSSVDLRSDPTVNSFFQGLGVAHIDSEPFCIRYTEDDKNLDLLFYLGTVEMDQAYDVELEH